MLRFIPSRSGNFPKKLYYLNSKRLLSFEEARSQILSHPTIQQHTNKIEKHDIESTDTLTECYHSFLSPNLSKLDSKEVLELQTYVLEKASLFEFGISDFLMREIISSKQFIEKGNQISDSILENIVKRNPGRRMTHLEYLNELQNLSIDIKTRNNKLMISAFNKILESSETAENEDLVRNLTQATYLFINLTEESLGSHFSNLQLNQLISKIIVSNSTKLLELVLEKVATSNCNFDVSNILKTVATLELTTYQQFLITRFQLKMGKPQLTSNVLASYLNSVKLYGPFFKLTDGEILARGVSEEEEQVSNRELNLTNRLNIKENVDYYNEVVQAWKNGSISESAITSEINNDLERILYLNNASGYKSINKKSSSEFEKVFRYCHAAISGDSKVTLAEIDDFFKLINYEQMTTSASCKIHQLKMLTASAVDNSEETQDYIIDVSNNNIAAYLETSHSLYFISTFIVSILMTRDVDLANYIKEGFYNNGAINKADIKQLGKFFVNYGEFSEEEQKSGVDGIFEKKMRQLIINEIVNRI